MMKAILCVIVALVGAIALPVSEKQRRNFSLPRHQNANLTDFACTKQIEEDYMRAVKKVRLASLRKPDLTVGAAVKKWKPSSGINPEELGSYLEGDILSVPSSQGRNGIISASYRWPKGVVYYRIIGSFGENQRKVIAQAMDAFHKNTCIRFRPYTGFQRDYVVIQSGNSGCWSTVGRVGGVQYLNLQAPGCLTMVGTAIHEMLHTIGFFHEQSRMDRDNHISLLWQNIPPRLQFNFRKEHSNTFGAKYDYGSVMHYSANAFSSNGKPTIVTKVPGSRIGQRTSLSAIDIAKINAMYKGIC